MATPNPTSRTAGRCRQRGLTMIEFMVSIAIGMIVVAALATLIADQSSNRKEVDRAGRIIESGRYAIRALADDLQMAGYWGELSTSPAAPAAWASPCGATPAAPTKTELVDAMGLHVTGFDVPGTATRAGYNDTAPALPATLGCLGNVKPGTDVLVVRHAEADSSPYEDAAGVADTAKLALPANGTRLFIQTGLDSATGLFAWRTDTGANGGTFDLKRKDKVTRATVRKFAVRLYYISTCSICTGTPDSLPSLKMRELVEGPAWSDPVTISEGIENLQIEYGVDTAANKDGAADGADVVASSLGVADWPGVVSVKIYLVARSTDPTPGYDDTGKKYPLGLAGPMVPAAGEESLYKRHVFVQSVRLVNPSFRRSS